MKLLFDFIPLLAFFIAFKIYDIFVATAVLMVACVLQITLFWLKNRRFETMHVATLAAVLVFGTATILLHDPIFIIWKATIVNWLFAALFLGTQFIGEKNLIQRLMEKNLPLPANVWTHLNISWVIFFAVMGFANLYVAFNFSQEVWVNFKVFGMLGLTLAFVLVQALYMARFMKEPEQNPSQQDKQ